MNHENDWDNVYKKEFNGTWYPSENVIKFSARYLKRRIGIEKWHVKKTVQNILDAGCGVGRHVVFFKEQGYEAHGIDISAAAIEIGNAWLKKQNLKPTLKIGDVTSIPFDSNVFDVVICNETLDHISFTMAMKAVSEINRVCKPNGYVYFSFRSTEDSEFDVKKEKEKHTIILEEGYEKGIEQHFFDLEEISQLLKNFKVFDISLIIEKFPSEYGKNKAYLQSAYGKKENLDTNCVNLGSKYARWHIVAENIK